MMHTIEAFLFVMILGAIVGAQDFKPVELPKPDTIGGKPLMQVLQNRHSTREYSADTLSLYTLSNLLWAACGINRTETGKRTAPSAMNMQEIDVYVAMAHGLFLYDPAKHTLQPVLNDDIREKTGTQEFVKDAPVNLVYVADFAKMSRGTDTEKDWYAGVDAAFMCENVYLFCASAGLATVVRGSVDRESLPAVMKLRPDQKVVLAQTVAYPKK